MLLLLPLAVVWNVVINAHPIVTRASASLLFLDGKDLLSELQCFGGCLEIACWYNGPLPVVRTS